MRQVLSIAVAVVLLVAGSSALRVTAQQTALRDLLPSAADFGPGFVAIDDRPRSLGEQAAMFGAPDDAARRLAEWGWQDNAFVVFQATELTAGGAPVATVDISLTRFASDADAAAALAYFLDDRAAVLGQWEAQPLSQWAGGELRTIAGPVPGGNDTTVYARSGPLLLRASATAAPGQSAPAPEAIAREIITRFTGQMAPVSVGVMQPAAETLFPSLASFETLPLENAACFRVAGEGDMDLPAVVERLAAGEDVAGSLDDLGWDGGVYRQFACDPEPGHAGWIDLSVHRFPDAVSAADAVTLFAETRARGTDLQPAPLTALGDGDAAIAGPAVNGREYTRYVSRGPLLFAVTGVAPEGDPRPDVEEVAAALVALPLEEPAPLAVAATSTPYTLGEPAPTVTVAAAPPTATAIPPTPMPPSTVPPTAPPQPTATAIPPTPVPTSTPLPTAPPPTPTPVPTEAPALIPVAVPPQPTATAGPLPTATPRVINLPTPDAG
jgi:hypothetical protein